MLDSICLDRMSQISVEKQDIQKLADVGSVKINPKLPPAQRLNQYIEQIQNPYCFRSGNMKVKVSYALQGKTLDDTLKNFFVGLKNC